MKKNLLVLCLVALTIMPAIAQNVIVKGRVTDAATGEPFFNANIIYEAGKGTMTDFGGYYELNLPAGDYELTFSYIGCKKKVVKVEAKGKTVFVDVKLTSTVLDPVKIFADIAIDRQTPVAFSNVTSQKIEEELGTMDIPMLLNSTPGVYSTPGGGGDGDADITIRGFSQRNVAVMIDGIPMNDMENGWVYWSNWFGLDAVTRTIQVQRGLGASKLSTPAVGGSINIITKGLESRPGITFSQDVGDNGYLRTSIGLTTGRLKGDWGLTAAASFKKNDGYVDQNYSKAFFYYVKAEKQIKKSMFSFSAMNAPQEHGQRSYKKPMAYYDQEYALSAGVPQEVIDITPNYGFTYNEHWGYLNRESTGLNDSTVGSEIVSEKVNEYQKPIFQLKHIWAPSTDFTWSTVAYASFGYGGGTGKAANTKNGTAGSSSSWVYDENGQLDFQDVWNNNTFVAPFNLNVSPLNGEIYSSRLLARSVNSHKWYGLLSTFNKRLSKAFKVSGGIDAKYYRGIHYKEVSDLLGGDHYIEGLNENIPLTAMYVGDTIQFHNDGLVNRDGAFFQTEYTKGRWSAFINVTAAFTSYKRVDYFKKRDLVLGDSIYYSALGYGDSAVYDGDQLYSWDQYDKSYYDESSDKLYIIDLGPNDTTVVSGTSGNIFTKDSDETRVAQSQWQSFFGYTFKAGANYNINDEMNVFANFGYLNNAPQFKYVFNGYTNDVREDVANERVKAVEIGYAYVKGRFSLNLNGYYTMWENKPVFKTSTVYFDGDTYSAELRTMDAIHKGLECDFSVNVLKNLNLQGLVSLGDWRWASADSVEIYDDANELVGKQYFNAIGVHVSDAAQSQFGFSVRYEPIKYLYISLKGIYYDRYFADFDPITLDGTAESQDENGNSLDSYKVPSYFLLNAHIGYTFKVNDNMRLKLSGSCTNIFDAHYIVKATNNDTYSIPSYTDYDAKSASVFFGYGRRWNMSLKFMFNYAKKKQANPVN